MYLRLIFFAAKPSTPHARRRKNNQFSKPFRITLISSCKQVELRVANIFDGRVVLTLKCFECFRSFVRSSKSIPISALAWFRQLGFLSCCPTKGQHVVWQLKKFASARLMEPRATSHEKRKSQLSQTHPSFRIQYINK